MAPSAVSEWFYWKFSSLLLDLESALYVLWIAFICPSHLLQIHFLTASVHIHINSIWHPCRFPIFSVLFINVFTFNSTVFSKQTKSCWKNGNKKDLRCLKKSKADVRLGKCIRLIAQFFNSENTNLILSLTTNSILGVFHSILHRRSAISLIYNFTGDVFINCNRSMWHCFSETSLSRFV